MASYKIQWRRSAAKELKKLRRDVIRRILKAIEQLAENPFPHGVKKLIGTEHNYRLRVGNYRIIYKVESSVLIVEIIHIAHRKDVYRH